MSKEYPNSNDMMGRFLRTGGVWVRHDNAEPFGSPRRICPRKPKTPRNLNNLGGTTKLEEPWWNLDGTFRGTLWQPKTDLPQRTIESESNSAPKPFLWLKTPKSKAIAVGEKTARYQMVRYKLSLRFNSDQ